MSRKNTIQLGQKALDVPNVGSDVAIYEALQVCRLAFKSNDSLTSPVRSIPQKVAKLVDPVFLEFTERIQCPPIGWSRLSELVNMSQNEAASKILEWGKFLNLVAYPGRWELKDPFSYVEATLDLILKFNRLCHAYQPTSSDANVVVSSAGRKIIEETRKRNSRKTKPDELHTFTLYSDFPFCKLCPTLVETEQYKLRYSKEKTILPLIIKGHSSQYCDEHSPDNGIFYKRDLKRLSQSYAVKRLLTDVRRSLSRSPLKPEIIRSLVHLLVFKPKKMMRSITQWHHYYLDLKSSGLIDQRSEEYGVIRMDFYHQILLEAKKHNLQLFSIRKIARENAKIEDSQLSIPAKKLLALFRKTNA